MILSFGCWSSGLTLTVSVGSCRDDAWLLDRKNTQPTAAFFNNSIGSQAAQMEAIAQADSVDDMFSRLEKAGVFLRLDTDVKPTMFHGATISQLELEQLRRVQQIIRMGRVTAITPDRIVLENGDIPTNDNTLHIDCSASALMNLKHKACIREWAYHPTDGALLPTRL